MGRLNMKQNLNDSIDRSDKAGQCCLICKNKNCPVTGSVSSSALTCIHKK